MSNYLISSEVNITVYPEIFSLEDGHEITLGDLHGNALKLLFILVSNGIIEISEEDYLAFVAIYSGISIPNPLTLENLRSFLEILERCIVYPGSVRLIGDEFADRGANDYFTLKILKKLHENNVNLEILISNHGIEFLQASESYTTTGNFLPKDLTGFQSISLNCLNEIVTKGFISPQEILDFVEQIYLPCLKLISYSYNPESAEFIFFSHAPIGLNVVEALALQFSVDFENENIHELMNTIDNINRIFQARANEKQVYATLCPKEILSFFGGRGAKNLKNSPYAELVGAAFVCTIWNRDLSFIANHRPPIVHGINAFFVHGHDGSYIEHKHIINLDYENELGGVRNMIVPCVTGKMIILMSLCAPTLTLSTDANEGVLMLYNQADALETTVPSDFHFNPFIETFLLRRDLGNLSMFSSRERLCLTGSSGSNNDSFIKEIETPEEEEAFLSYRAS